MWATDIDNIINIFIYDVGLELGYDFFCENSRPRTIQDTYYLGVFF